MSTTAPTLDEVPASTSTTKSILRALNRSSATRMITAAAVLFVLLCLARLIADANGLTSARTAGATLRVTIPLLLAGLAGLWAERVGVLNIGIEGMMILGTWFGAWGAWQVGPWVGLLLGVLGGALGGLLHAVATVRFNVDHVISGVALNLIAFGGMRFLSDLVFTGHGGGISQSPPQQSGIPKFNVPLLAGGELFGWRSPDVLGSIERHRWFIVSDLAGILRGLLLGLSWASVIALALLALTAWVIFRTTFGLRVRSSGEAPGAAESLGVRVVRVRYLALLISGGFAGLGGAFLSVVSATAYRQGQTANRGYIGLATMIFGNWRPSGLLGGATLFGFAEALQLVGPDSLTALFLFFTFVAGLLVIVSLLRRRLVSSLAALAAGALLLVAYITVDKVPEPLTKAAPYIVTLIVLATASQRLRPPAHAGIPWRPGDTH